MREKVERMGKKVKIGFVGSGFMGQKAHLDNYVTFPECEIVALAEGRQKTAAAVARKYNIPKVYSNHRALLASEDVDAVVAIMGYRLHHGIVADVLKAGKHVITEKPMCVRVETGKELVQLAQKKNLIHQVGYMKRFVPASSFAKGVIEGWKASGEAGKMTYIRASMPPGDWVFRMDPAVAVDDPWPAYEGQSLEPMPSELSETDQSFYDMFINYYIHQINMIRFLLGEAFHIEYAEASGAILVARSESGVPVVLEMKGYGLKNAWEEYYKVCFEDGKIDLSVPAPLARQNPGDVLVYRGSGPRGVPLWERPSLPADWCFKMQAMEFVHCVAEGRKTISPAGEAVQDLEVAMEYVKAMSKVR